MVFFGFTVIFGLFALAGLVLGVVGLATLHVVPGIVSVGAALVFGGVSWGFVHLAHRGGPALTIAVCPDAITMSRHHQVTDTIHRQEIGLVLIRVAGRAGVTSIDVFGPDRNLVGRWDPNWGPAGPIRIMRALRRLRYPWAAHDVLALFWRDKFRSKLAPTWTDEVV